MGAQKGAEVVGAAVGYLHFLWSEQQKQAEMYAQPDKECYYIKKQGKIKNEEKRKEHVKE